MRLISFAGARRALAVAVLVALPAILIACGGLIGIVSGSGASFQLGVKN